MTPSAQFLAQHAALSQSVGVADLSDRTRLALTGADRVTFLHSFCTNDIKQLAVGHGCEAFVTNPQGKTLGHVLVFCQHNRLLLDTSPGQSAVLTAHFDKYLISEDVQFHDLTAQQGELLLAGPQADEILSRLSGAAAPAENLAVASAKIAGCNVEICRVEYAGPQSFFVQTARADLPNVRSAFQQAGAVACDDDAVEARRLESAFPLFGRDITDDNLPQEIARDTKAISFRKGCYLGQETVARIDALGHVNRMLVRLKFASESIPPAGMTLQADGKDIGHVTSAAWSPQLNAPLAMAYVRRSHARPATPLNSPAGTAELLAPATNHL